jgi:hypothetical protein
MKAAANPTSRSSTVSEATKTNLLILSLTSCEARVRATQGFGVIIFTPASKAGTTYRHLDRSRLFLRAALIPAFFFL